jgi:hypothetical protein
MFLMMLVLDPIKRTLSSVAAPPEFFGASDSRDTRGNTVSPQLRQNSTVESINWSLSDLTEAVG